MISNYKTYLQAGDEGICKSTLQRFNRRLLSSDNQQGLINVNQTNEMNVEEEILPTCESAFVARQESLFDNVENNENNSREYDEDAMSDNCREILSDIDETEFNPRLSKKKKSLQEFIESPEFSERISAEVNKTVGEIFLMIILFSISNSLSLSALTNLVKLVNSIFIEPILPESRYLIDEILNPKSSAEFHAVCHKCTSYVGKFGEIDKRTENCEICEAPLNLSNPSNLSYFVLINPATQIADILHANENYYDYIINERRHKQDVIEDIYDGKGYREFKKNLSEEDKRNYVTAVVNTDGAPKFKCSQFSIWPIYLMLNELNPQERMTNLITCGLWFHKKKPEMRVFLQLFVDLINKLLEEGIHCIVKGDERVIKLYPLICCVDSVARAPIQGIKQFNGNFGCSWCLHPGKWSEGSMRYPLLPHIPECRKHDTTVLDMLNMNPSNPTNGIKYPSPFINLPLFNIIQGFVPDYLHCCLEGVAKQFTEYYLESMQLNEIEEELLDSVMNNIAVPYQVSRLTRPLSIRNDWKAREWENFILYTSIPVFSTKLNEKFLKHWILFVESLYILLKDNLDINELNHADEMMCLFVVQAEQYFGTKAMTFNLHQLLHLSESVLNWGPLWAHSTFAFESNNYQILRAIKCARGVNQQILRFININHSAMILKQHVYRNVPMVIKFYCEDILFAKLKNVLKMSDNTYLGKITDYNIDDTPTAHLNLSIGSTKIYYRMIKHGCLYTTSTFNRKSNDSFAQLDDKRFIQIISFIVDTENNQEFTLCYPVYTRNCFSNNSYKPLQQIESIADQITVVSTMSIKTICVFIAIADSQYLCTLPNLLHY